MSKPNIFPALLEKIQEVKELQIPAQRKEILQPLIEFIQRKKNNGKPVRLNFICTHNSRRSQLAQVWARAISSYYEIETACFSGGTEETAFFKNAIEALKRAGFQINSEKGENPKVEVRFSENEESLFCYSKVFDAPENPSDNFAAVMTCSHADENCPFIPGADARVALDYADPKEFDNSPLAAQKYDERSNQIASEMIYVFENIK